MTVRVVLVDDQALIRTGFKMILESESDIEVVGEAGDGREGISVTRSARPDVVLMDVQMPNMNGLEATGRIVEDASISSRVIILTTFERDDYVFEALRAGASGFLLKNCPPEDLVHAVRIVAKGDALLAPSVTRTVIEAFATSVPGAQTKPNSRASQSEKRRSSNSSRPVRAIPSLRLIFLG